MLPEETVIANTRKWIRDVVIGCNFCPFAAREVKKESIGYEVVPSADTDKALLCVKKVLQQLDNDAGIETVFILLPGTFASFEDYLDLVADAQDLLEREGYEGIYQLASFHPEYLFADSGSADAANYTNRSPYPMLHLLREASVSRAVDSYPDTDLIPEKNMAYARQKGLAYMQALKNACT